MAYENWNRYHGRDLGTETATTTNDYADLISLAIPPHITKLTIRIRENNVNAIKYKIEGSYDVDFTNPTELKAETIVAKDGTAPVETLIEDPWLYIRVQHKASVADAQGNTTVEVMGS